MRRIAAALACLLLATVTHAAREAGWERVFPSLDDVRAVVWYDPPETWWVTSWTIGERLVLLRTEDDGTTWETITSGLDAGRAADIWGVRATYAVSRPDPSVIYRPGGSVERSNDGGATWEELWPLGLFPQRVREVLWPVAVVSPDHADRIAFNDSGAEDEFGVAHLTRSVRVTDVVSGDRATHSGAFLWTHPETGAAYWLGDRSVGVVNFDALTFDQVGSDHEQIGGFGFVSDDPLTLLTTTYDVD
ncbi:MAG: hypothetical protein ABGY41_06495, partial [Candidatus Poribacteria bacterium]